MENKSGSFFKLIKEKKLQATIPTRFIVIKFLLVIPRDINYRKKGPVYVWIVSNCPKNGLPHGPCQIEFYTFLLPLCRKQ